MKRIAALLLVLALTGCTLQPLYSGGGKGVVAQGLHSVQLGAIPGRAGWLVRTALEDRMAPSGSARFRLEVELDDQIVGFGLRRSDDGITRQRRTLRARYRLVDAGLGTVLLDATAGSDASVDVVGSEYATVSAEQTALERLAKEVADQIVARVALYMARTGRRPQSSQRRIVKANRGQVEKAFRAGGSQHRFFLLHGPDESGSRGLLKLIAEGLGPDSDRIDVSGAELRADPARLADEAASIPLFGGARYIIVEAAGDESIAAVEALLEAPQAGNPVILIAGALRPTSRLLKLALADPNALAFASYVPEGGDADRLVLDLGRQRGLPMRPDVARRIADAAGANRAVIESELDKFALYLDASPERPQTLEQDIVDLLGAASEGGDLSRLVDSVVGGDPQLLDAELLRLSSEGVEGVLLVRAVLRRMLLLARLRGEVDRGNSVDSVMTSQGKSLFWKEKPVVAQQLGRWRSDLLARAAGRLLESERQVKAAGGLGPLAVEEEMFAICRQAARLR